MPSDAIWVALIAALAPLALEYVRVRIKRTDAEATRDHETKRRKASEASALETVAELKREIYTLRRARRRDRALRRTRRRLRVHPSRTGLARRSRRVTA